MTAQETKVLRLLEWGADPNVVYGPTLMTPLHMAASWHRTELVSALLAHGADPAKPDVNGLTPLHCAVVYGDPDSVRRIVQTGAVDLNGTVTTVRGELDIMDCVLECEAPDHVVRSPRAEQARGGGAVATTAAAPPPTTTTIRAAASAAAAVRPTQTDPAVVATGCRL